MIRTTIICTLLAAPAAADMGGSYMAAIEDAVATSQSEYDTFIEAVGEGSYDTSALEDRGWLLRYGVGDAALAFPVELIAVYDHDTRICTWGFDSDTYANLPRTAALAVRDHGVAQGWPEEAIASASGRPGDCTSRSLIASTVGELVYIDALRFGNQTVYFGFPNMGLGT